MTKHVWPMITLLAGCAAAPSTRPLSSPVAAPRVRSPEPAKPSAVRGTPATTALNANRTALYERACKLGSARACNDLAVHNEADPAYAKPLFERACELGSVRGCTNLAYFLAREPDQIETAAKILETSCKASDELACASLGDLQYSGDRVEKNDARACASYERACELQHWVSCASAGWMIRRGEGVARDPKRALERFRAACEHQSYMGCTGLGVSLVEDALNEQDVTRGLQWLDLACEQRQADACMFLGFRQVLPDGTIPLAAQRSFARGCKLGDENGCALRGAAQMPAPMEPISEP